MYYLTLGDQPSGVYSSQVSDVCRHLASLEEAVGGVQLVAMFSMRGFVASRRRVRAEVPGAAVLPAWPRLHRWRKNVRTLAAWMKWHGRGPVMARGPLAASVALELRDRNLVSAVCFDGRGAIAAEWEEYDIVPSATLRAEIESVERRAVIDSDIRLAVSEKLVEYWRERFGYAGDDHVVVPCTLRTGFAPPLLDESARVTRRKQLGFSAEDVVLAYSGSASGWQSFELLEEQLDLQLRRDHRMAVLFLAPMNLDDLELARKHPGRVRQAWLPHEEVAATLAACDYGILVRERTVTNRVASPTKLAEYLACGLPVLISEELGDATQLVRELGCGRILADGALGDVELPPVDLETRQRMMNIALTQLTKDAFREQYVRILRALDGGSR